MWSMTGLCTGNVRSTPTWKLILRTVKVSRTPSPERPMTTPWKTWIRERLPSVMLTPTLTVSPGAKAGMSERSEAASTASRICMIITLCGRNRSTAGLNGKDVVCPRPSASRTAGSPEAEPGQGTNNHSAMDAATGQNGSDRGALLLGDDDDLLRIGGGRRVHRRQVGHALAGAPYDPRRLGLAPQLPQLEPEQADTDEDRHDHDRRPPCGVEEAE